MNINGNEFSWASVRARFLGVEVTDIKAISYADEIDGMDPVYGTGRHPRGRTAGRYKPGDASITFYRSGWKRLLAGLPSGYGDVRGTIVVQYREGVDMHQDVLEDVRIMGVDGKAEDGTDASEVEVKLSILRINHDGKYLVAKPGEA